MSHFIPGTVATCAVALDYIVATQENTIGEIIHQSATLVLTDTAVSPVLGLNLSDGTITGFVTGVYSFQYIIICENDPSYMGSAFGLYDNLISGDILLPGSTASYPSTGTIISNVTLVGQTIYVASSASVISIRNLVDADVTVYSTNLKIIRIH